MGSGPSILWKKHFIDGKLFGARMVRFVDMDGDNDIDVVASGLDGNVAVWYTRRCK
jgi:hypothetical protein